MVGPIPVRPTPKQQARIGGILVILLVCLMPYSAWFFRWHSDFPDSRTGDYWTYQLPIRQFVSESLRDGIFPHYNPHLLCGQALHASQQAGISDPLMTPWLLLFETDRAIRSGLLMQLALAVFGQVQICAHFRCSRQSSLVACLLITGSGWTILHLREGHLGLVAAGCRVPVFYASLLKMFAEGQTGNSGNAGLWLALIFLSGHPQLAYYCLLLLGGLCLVFTCRSLFATGLCSESVRNIFRPALKIVSVVMIGACLSTVQWLPSTLWLADDSDFGQRRNARFFREFGLEVSDAAGLFIPPHPVLDRLGVTQNPNRGPNHERTLWIGVTASFVLLVSWWRCAVPKRIGLVLLVFVLGFCAGRYPTSCDRVLISLVPGWGLFRCHGRFWIMLLPIVGVSVASTLDRWRPAFLPQRRILRRRCKLSDQVRAVLVVCCVLESWGSTWLSLTAELPNTLHGRNQPRLHSVLLPGDARFLEWPGMQLLTESHLRYARHVHDAMELQRSMPGTNEGGPMSAGQQMIHRALRRDPLGTARLIGCSHVLTGGASGVIPSPMTLGKIRIHRHDASAELFRNLPDLTRSDHSELFASQDQSTVLTDTRKANTIVIQCERRTAGWLVIAEAYSPNWRIRINGRPVQPVQIHGCLLGLAVAPGRSDVEMDYCSPGFHAGLLISALAATMTLAGSLQNVANRAFDTVSRHL